MMTIEQCRGARGILAWTQQDLADASGLSKTAINNFEKGHSDIKAESLRAIRMAFESADIEFIDKYGVSKKVETIKILRGASAMNDLIQDIHKTITTPEGEILISFADQAMAERISTQLMFQHIDFLKTTNTSQRILCTQNLTNVLSPMDECRWVGNAIKARNMPCFIYGGKVAFELWDSAMIIVINSAEANEGERERFEYLWHQAQKTSENTNAEAQKTA